MAHSELGILPDICHHLLSEDRDSSGNAAADGSSRSGNPHRDEGMPAGDNHIQGGGEPEPEGTWSHADKKDNKNTKVSASKSGDLTDNNGNGGFATTRIDLAVLPFVCVVFTARLLL